MVGAIATIGDMVSPRERGQYMGYMMAAMMVAMIAGPLVGGYITDSLSWRWIFYINMPIGGAALVYLWATHAPAAQARRAQGRLPRCRRHRDRRHRDRPAHDLGRHPVRVGLVGDHACWPRSRPRRSPRSSVVEGRAVEPILPLHVFKNRNFSLASSMSFLLGFAMLGALTFLPLYQQTVQHASPTTSGLHADPADARLDRHHAHRGPDHHAGPGATRSCRSSAASIMTRRDLPADAPGAAHHPA